MSLSSSESSGLFRPPSLTILLFGLVPTLALPLGPAFSGSPIQLIPNTDSLRSPKLRLDDLNVLVPPDVCALTRDKSIPDLCRRGVGGGGIGRDDEAAAESDPNSAGDSGTGDIGVGIWRDCNATPESILPLDTCILFPWCSSSLAGCGAEFDRDDVSWARRIEGR